MPGAVVIGTGFGARIHVPALRAAGFDVLGLVGTDPDRTQRRADRIGVRGATSVADALDLDGVDLVVVASPPATHHPFSLAALAAGKHVLCEKPFTLTSGQAAELLQVAVALGRVHAIGHEFRFAPERRAAHRAIAEGAIGEPRLAAFVQHIGLVADPATPMPSWWFDRAAGGGWLLASGSHLVDQARSWLGELTLSSAWLGLVSDRDPASADDSFRLSATSELGPAEVGLTQSGGSWGPMAGITRVSGTHGSVWLDADGCWLADKKGTRLLAGVDVAPPSADARHRFSHLELGPYTALYRSLLGAIRGDAPFAGATFADGYAVMSVLDEARRLAGAAGGSRSSWVDGLIGGLRPDRVGGSSREQRR